MTASVAPAANESTITVVLTEDAFIAPYTVPDTTLSVTSATSRLLVIASSTKTPVMVLDVLNTTFAKSLFSSIA